MPITESDLRRNYASQPTDVLLELRAQGTLTELALGVLEHILDERGVPVEQREQATAEVKARLEEEAQEVGALASLGKRLGAEVIDSVIAVAILLGGFAIGDGVALYAVLLSAAYLLLADGLPRGQSLGKRMLGMAVVDQATKKPCTFAQSFVRNLLLGILGFIDWVFIFGATRQRLGDLAASTIVVKV